MVIDETFFLGDSRGNAMLFTDSRMIRESGKNPINTYDNYSNDSQNNR